MNLFQIVILLVILLGLQRTFIKYRRRVFNWQWTLVWTIFWLLLAALVIYPELTNIVAHRIGVGRGVDVAIYFGILILFFLVFKIFTRLNETDKKLSKLVKNLAIEKARKK
jgi:hypothetical protein